MVFEDKLHSSGIYKITNIINGKFYIGSAKNLFKRFLIHRSSLRGNYHSNKHLQSSFNKYKEENFKFEVLELVNMDCLLIREKYWIDKTMCHNREIGFNISKNPTSVMEGYKFSEETIGKRNISIANSWTDERRKKQSLNLLKYKSNPEFEKKRIEAVKRHEKSEKERQEISERKRGSKHHNARLTEEIVREIKIMHRDGFTNVKIAKKFNVSQQTISKIVNNHRWKHVSI